MEGSEGELPLDWQLAAQVYGYTHFAAVPIYDEESNLAGALVALCAAPVGTRAEHPRGMAAVGSPPASVLMNASQMHLLSQELSHALFPYPTAHSRLRGVPQLTCKALQSIFHAPSLTSLLYSVARHCCVQADQLHHLELSARAALAPSPTSQLAVMLGLAASAEDEECLETLHEGSLTMRSHGRGHTDVLPMLPRQGSASGPAPG